MKDRPISIGALFAAFFPAGCESVPTPVPLPAPPAEKKGAGITLRLHAALDAPVTKDVIFGSGRKALVSDVTGMMGQDGRGGPPDAYAFSTSGGSYRIGW